MLKALRTLRNRGHDVMAMVPHGTQGMPTAQGGLHEVLTAVQARPHAYAAQGMPASRPPAVVSDRMQDTPRLVSAMMWWPWLAPGIQDMHGPPAKT